MKKKLHPAQKKSILDFLGYPISQLPTTVKELNEMMAFVTSQNPEQYKLAYDIIVNHKLPEGSGINENLLFEKVGKLIDSDIYDKVSKNLNIIEAVTNSLTGALEENAAKAFEEAKRNAEEKMRVIHVKVGNKKAKKLSGVVPEYFEKLLKKAQSRINVMLVGPAGSGKTHIAGMLAEALDLDFASQSCTAGMSESALSGWLIPTGDGGCFEYVSSEFVRIYENGGVFLFDEMDAADPNVLIFINQAIANGGFSLPIRHKNPKVIKHKDFVCIAATNTFGGGADSMYHARNALDAATLDRFKAGMISVGYSEAVEEQLVDINILQWGRLVRGIINKHNLRRIMSTRVMLDFTVLKTEQDYSMEEIKHDYFIDWSPEEKRMVNDLT